MARGCKKGNNDSPSGSSVYMDSFYKAAGRCVHHHHRLRLGEWTESVRMCYCTHRSTLAHRTVNSLILFTQNKPQLIRGILFITVVGAERLRRPPCSTWNWHPRWGGSTGAYALSNVNNLTRNPKPRRRIESGPAIEHSNQRNGTSASCAELHFRSVAYHFIYAETLLRVSGSGGKHFSLYYAVPLARELYYERVHYFTSPAPDGTVRHSCALNIHFHYGCIFCNPFGATYYGAGCEKMQNSCKSIVPLRVWPSREVIIFKLSTQFGRCNDILFLNLMIYAWQIKYTWCIYQMTCYLLWKILNSKVAH